MSRSDETSDEPGLTGSASATGADVAVSGNLPSHALRERIRRASVAAQGGNGAAAAGAQPNHLEIPSAPPPANTRSSLPPEHSGVRARPNEPERHSSEGPRNRKSEPDAAATLPPPVFLPPPAAAARPAGRGWPFAPSGNPRTPISTQIGLGEPSSEWMTEKTRSRTPPMPSPALHPSAPAFDTEAASGIQAQPEATRARRPALPTLPLSAAGLGAIDPHAPSSSQPPLAAPANLHSTGPVGTLPPVEPAARQESAPSRTEPPSVHDLVTADTAPMRLPSNLPQRPPPLPRPSYAAAAGDSSGRFSVPNAGEMAAIESERFEAPAVLASSDAVLVDETDTDEVTMVESGQLSDEDGPDDADDADKEPTQEVLNQDDSSARARRYTPKQRPAHRRARQLDGTRSTGPGRFKDDRALARVAEDRARTLTEPRVRAPERRSAPASEDRELRRRDTRDERVRPVREPEGQASVPPSRLLPAGPTSEPRTRVGGHGINLVHDDHAEIARTLPDRPAVHAPLPGRSSAPLSPRSMPSGPARPSAPEPTLRGDSHAPPQRSGRPVTPYEPLPRDRAGFEAFMRQRAADAEANGSRPNWKEQETLLIPREALEQGPDRVSFWSSERVPWLIGTVLAMFLVASTLMFVRQRTTDASAVRAIPMSDSPAATPAATANGPTTLIATEPSGAELLLGGAVLGNTPVEVARPQQGEETYFLRMRGFESQLVRVSPHSSAAIRVMLVPQGAR